MKKIKLHEKIMLMLTLILASILFVIPTLAKYVAQTNLPFEGEEHLDYTVNAVFVVRTQDELFSAINQGYTYVQLDKDIENPLIVTQKAETLDRDLILDLNGIEIQRNGYDPILNIREGVRLTVVDTSAEQTGGLYNPVGSVFNITGGTLTVVTGTFESGPRYSEYYTYNNGILNDTAGSDTKRTIVENSAQPVNFFRKSGTGSDIEFKADNSVSYAPIIKSYPEKTGDIEYNHGNLYFDEVVNESKVLNTDLTIRPDTYCYYRTSEDVATDSSDVSMADWYYTYFVNPSNFTYVGKTGNLEDHIEVTIYGYENTIKQASVKENPADYYAAIQMQSGTLEVQNGGFYSYFGVDKTACVNSQGGAISVKNGEFSSRIPNATMSTGTVSIKEIDELAFDESYFNTFKWSDSTTNYTQTVGGVTYNGRLAKQGESFCILNGGNATVSIGKGNCYSSNNNIISMNGGSLSIGGGTFTKKNTIALGSDFTSKAPAIYMSAGELSISNTNYNIYGDRTSAIYMLDGKITVNNSSYLVEGSNTMGIYSAVSGNDNFVVTDTSFEMTNGTYQTGILATSGKVQVSSTGTSHISTSGTNGVGIHVRNGGSVSSTNYAYTLNGAYSKGIYAEEDALGIDVTSGSFNIQGNSSFGIQSYINDGGTDDKFNVTNASITMTNGINQTGIYSNRGRVNVKSTSSATISIAGENGKGIHVANGGSVSSNGYSYILQDDNSYGIYAIDGDVGVVDGNFDLTGDNQFGIYANNGDVNVNSSSAKITVTGANGKGIHVENGGSVTSTNYTYTLNGEKSKGIYAATDALSINVTGGQFNIQGYNSFGIESFLSGTDKFNVTNASITMTNGTGQTGIYSANGRVNVKATSKATISIAGANGKGIHVANGGSVSSEKYSYTLNGATSYGIYSVDGQIDIKGGDVTLASNNNCYGIFATANTTNAYTITTDGVNISVGAGITTDKTGTHNASIGIYMSSNNAASRITLNGSKITSYELGIVVDGGQVDISGTGGQITTENASAVAIFGGSITFNEGSEYAITSKNTRDNNTTNGYTINLPKLSNYRNTDGIYVSGGSFVSNGDVSITHTGLRNVTTQTLYTQETVTSYAVRVSGTGASVNITKATITANIGGGVNCENGTVTLGKTGSAMSDIVINTIGEEKNGTYDPIGVQASDWRVPKSVTGGHGIELTGANSKITVYNAMIEACMGNGILVNGKSTSTIDIYDGDFKGWVGKVNRTNNISGIGAFYGLKVIGAATVNIKNGTFMGGNGGALITGVDSFTSRTNYKNSENTRGKVYVERGEFGDSGTKDSFYLYEGADVYLGTLDASVTMTAQERRNAIKIIRNPNAGGAQFSVNTLGYGNFTPGNDLRTKAYIYYGDYGTSNSTYNANGYGYIYVYNRGNSIDYTNFSGGGQREGFNAHTIVNNTTARYYPYTTIN